VGISGFWKVYLCCPTTHLACEELSVFGISQKKLRCKHNVSCIATPCGDVGNRMLRELSENFYACEILSFVFGNSCKCYPVPQLDELGI